MDTHQPARPQFGDRRRQLEQILRQPGPEPHELAELSRDEWLLLERLSEPAEVPSGGRLIAQGEFADEFFVIEAGIACVTRNGRQVAVLGPGDFFGEIAMLREDTRTATVHAVSEMRVRVVRGAAFDRLLRAVPVLARRIREATGDRVLAQAAQQPVRFRPTSLRC